MNCVKSGYGKKLFHITEMQKLGPEIKYKLKTDRMRAEPLFK